MTRPLIVVCGPTGAGKSALAIDLARAFAGEIVNADSLQVFRQFDIGTAKLPESERAGIRHHLIDAAEPGEGFTAGDFSLLGRQALEAIAAAGRIAIVCGGTGFYIRALIGGLSPAPGRDERLRERLAEAEREHPGVLHRLLRRMDKPAALRIHRNDAPKLERAIEICALTPQTASTQPSRDSLTGYRVLTLGLFPERAELYEALDRRCEQMFAGGLLDEIRRILENGAPRAAKPFQSLGYKEGLAFLDGKRSRGEALTDMQRDTRRYAKRQITWFRREPGIEMLAGFGTDPAIQWRARSLVERWVNLK